MEPPSIPRLLKIFFAVLILLLVLGSTLKLATNFVWDDSYMFARYADRVIADGTLSFNEGEPAAYGLTSLAYLSLVIPFRLLVPSNPAWSVFLASWVSGLLFLGALVFFLKRHLPGNPTLRFAGVLLVLLSLGKGLFLLGAHFVSGMDTLFALLYLTVYLCFAKDYEGSPTSRRAVALGLMGGGAFVVRPDLLVFTWLVALALTVFSRENRSRASDAVVLGATVGSTVIFSLLAWYWLNSPVPLPFYAKALGLYGEFINLKYQYIPGTQLLAFLQTFSFLLIPLLAAALVAPKRFWNDLSAVDRGILVGLPIFGAYYYFMVLQIMFYQSRFFFPLLPGLAYLGAKSAIHWVQEWGLDQWDLSVAEDRAKARTAAVVFTLIMIWTIPDPMMRLYMLTKNRDRTLNLAEYVVGKPDRNWFMLSEFSRGPDDLVIATTEVGLPLALNPRKKIIDLAGLNETEIAHQGFKASTFFNRHQPDLIYLPHPDYVEMIQEIQSDPFFQKHYELFPAEFIKAKMSVALKRESRHYGPMKGLMIKNLQRLGVLEARGPATRDPE